MVVSGASASAMVVSGPSSGGGALSTFLAEAKGLELPTAKSLIAEYPAFLRVYLFHWIVHNVLGLSRGSNTHPPEGFPATEQSLCSQESGARA